MNFDSHNHSVRVPRLPGFLSDFLFEVGVGAVRQTNSEIQRELESAERKPWMDELDAHEAEQREREARKKDNYYDNLARIHDQNHPQ